MKTLTDPVTLKKLTSDIVNEKNKVPRECGEYATVCVKKKGEE